MSKLLIGAIIVAIVAALLGFTGVAGAAAGIAQIAFYILVAFVIISLVMNVFKRA